MDNDTSNLDLYARKAALEKERDLLKRIKELKQNYGLDFYKPHWKQHLFHTCDATSRYGRTGNRFGKSEMGDAEDVAWCVGGRLWYRKDFNIYGMQKVNGVRTKVLKEAHVGRVDHPYITQGIPNYPVKGLLLVVNWDKAKEVHTNRTDDPKTCGKLWKLIPKELIGKVHLSRGGHIEKIEIKRPREFGGGVSTLTIRTVEGWKHNEMSGESGDYDFIHIDEPVPEDMYKSFARGLMDRNGREWFTCTPLDEMWINDFYTPPATRTGVSTGEVKFEKEFEGVAAGSYYRIEGEVFDNPHMDDLAIAKFASTLTREQRECRLYGLPLAMAGMVYKEFIYNEHVLEKVPAGWKEHWLPPLNYTIRVAWDVHGARVPQAVLLVATAPDGTAFVYDEMFCEPLITPNAQLLARKLAGRNVLAQIIDPRALIKNPVTETCDVLDAIAEEGLYFDPASKDLTTGISAVKDKLVERHVVTDKPTIYFSPNLTQTLFEFTHYIYDLEKNEPKDKDNHMMENLYRLVLNGLEYVEPSSGADFIRRNDAIRFDEDRHGFNNATLKI